MLGVGPTPAEQAGRRSGDDLIPAANVVLDRAFFLPADVTTVFPWLAQLGKGRAGWYLPTALERLLPPRRRALRRIDPRWSTIAVGDVVPDYGPDGSFTVAALDPPGAVVFTARRGRLALSWSLTLTAAGPHATRVHLRLRLGPVRHTQLARGLGGAFDLLTIAAMAAGLRERLQERLELPRL